VLSVVVPAYNYARFLDAALSSVAAQGVDGLEVIVIDDGSSDDTAAVVARHARVRYVHQNNAGLSAARNHGLRLAQGELLTFLDADDLLAPGSLAARVRFMQTHPACGVTVCRNRQFYDAGRRRWLGRWYLPRERLDVRLCHFNIAPPHAFMLRRGVVAAVGEFDTGLRACEDHDYWLRALEQGAMPRYCPVGEVWYRKHGASMSADNANQVHHDSLLHERVFDALFVRATLPVAHSLGAALAAWSGLLATLSRLDRAIPSGVVDTGRLVDAFERSIQAAHALSPVSGQLGVLEAYYVALLLTARSRLASDLPAVVASVDSLLEVLAVRGCLHTADPTRLRSAVWNSALRPGAGAFVDRYRALRLCAALR
jgi:GT2 family glycosyltransferase